MTISKEIKSEPITTSKYFVHIIESPSANDLLNGHTEGRVLKEVLSLSNIISFYNLTVDYSSFLEALGPRLCQAMQENAGVPILHFSSHGNEEGIELTNSKFLKWHKLRELLLPINKAFNGGLIICMSSCSGFSGCKMAMSSDTGLPFYGLIGPNSDATWSETAVAFVTFYHLFSKGSAVPQAVKAMCTASGKNDFQFISGDKARQAWIDVIKEEERQNMIEKLQRLIAEQQMNITRNNQD